MSESVHKSVLSITNLLFPLIVLVFWALLYRSQLRFQSSLSFSALYSSLYAFWGNFGSFILTSNHKQHNPLQIILVWLREWCLMCLVLENVLLLATNTWNKALMLFWVVFCRTTEVFPVQADILLLQSMPERRLVSTQHCVQTCSEKVSVCDFLIH